MDMNKYTTLLHQQRVRSVDPDRLELSFTMVWTPLQSSSFMRSQCQSQHSASVGGDGINGFCQRLHSISTKATVKMGFFSNSDEDWRKSRWKFWRKWESDGKLGGRSSNLDRLWGVGSKDPMSGGMRPIQTEDQTEVHPLVVGTQPGVPLDGSSGGRLVSIGSCDGATSWCCCVVTFWFAW